MVGPGPKLRATAAAPDPCAPDDALVDMFGLLPANSLHRFKCVSKAWCGLVTDPLHRQRFAQTLAGSLCHVDGGTESSRLTCPNSTVPESKETTPRFISVSGMAKPHLDASLYFLSPPDDDAEGLRDVILHARDGLVFLSLWSARGFDAWCRQVRVAAMFFSGDPSARQRVDQHHRRGSGSINTIGAWRFTGVANGSTLLMGFREPSPNNNLFGSKLSRGNHGNASIKYEDIRKAAASFKGL